MNSLSLDDAQKRVERGISKARELGVAANIALVDGAAHLVYFARMDGALLGSVDLAQRKAKTAVLFRAESGARSAGMQVTAGRSALVDREQQ